MARKTQRRGIEEVRNWNPRYRYVGQAETGENGSSGGLRLYCPVITTVREASEDMTLGNLMIPKHTYLVMLLVKIHTSKEYWGEDANEFNPLRFMNGISNAAKHPNALLAFSIGPRACIMLEAKTVVALFFFYCKTVVALVLQRFFLSPSPRSTNMLPQTTLLLQPHHGLPIVPQPLNM
ncbi:hypothetical protein SLA2020_234330 [Shorea laevis]